MQSENRWHKLGEENDGRHIFCRWFLAPGRASDKQSFISVRFTLSSFYFFNVHHSPSFFLRQSIQFPMLSFHFLPIRYRAPVKASIPREHASSRASRIDTRAHTHTHTRTVFWYEMHEAGSESVVRHSTALLCMNPSRSIRARLLSFFYPMNRSATRAGPDFYFSDVFFFSPFTIFKSKV